MTASPLTSVQRVVRLVLLGSVVGALTCPAVQGIKVGFGERVETGLEARDINDSPDVAHGFFVGLFFGLIVGIGVGVMMLALDWSDRVGRVAVGLTAGFVAGLVAAWITVAVPAGRPFHEPWPPPKGSEVSRRLVSNEWDTTVMSAIGALLGLGIIALRPLVAASDDPRGNAERT